VKEANKAIDKMLTRYSVTTILHTQFMACVGAVQEVDSLGRPKETGNGYRSETCAVMPSKFWWYATPLKLEYDVQGVDDTLDSPLVWTT
jgi:hypothetical protein